MNSKKQSAEGEVNSDIFDWLSYTPPSDSNFKSNLERANIPTIRQVLLRMSPENNKTRRHALEARLRKLEKDSPAQTETPTATDADTAQIVAVELHRIMPSPFEPQKRRRARFKQEEIESLGDSIVSLGMFQPIVVRPDFPNFQIVFGERRFLASKTKNLKTIDCFIRDLSDAEVLELQYEENHRRQENNPLDDAFLFRFLKETQNYTEDQIADRLNTTRRNVTDKLKLNDLIGEAKTDLEAGRLPLKHAVYMAKFPEAAQIEIRREKYAHKYNDAEEKAVSFDEFRAEVEENILRRLKTAPFNIGDPRLHIKQLLCVNCPEQTGNQNYLFPDHADADARCLNPTCFRLKTDTHLKLERESIALETKPEAILSSADWETATAAVPLVTEKSYAPERTPFKEKVLTNIQPLNEPECEFSELGLAVGGEHKGKQVYLCRNDDCPVHHPKPPESEKRIDEKAVAERVRFEVFSQAIKWFDDYKSFWQFDDLIQVLIVKSLMATVNSPSGDKIRRIVKDWTGAPPHFINKTLVEKFVAGLDKKQQSQILFLLTYENELYTFRSDAANDETIRAIAADYTKLDYDLLTEITREEIGK